MCAQSNFYTDALAERNPDYPIEPLLLGRWSPRSMTGESIDQDRLLTLFEAARWAPSTYNEQEWRFLYSCRDDEHWDKFFNLLADANKAWCEDAACLIVATSCNKLSRNGKINPVHSFDCGLAVQNLLLQATALGVVAHGIAGFDEQAARTKLGVPDDVSVEAMIAVGIPAPADELPEKLREKEEPSQRRPLHEIVHRGGFNFTNVPE
ncbi:MAG: nitroreductase family protein [Planctomycetales bacterium]|nr:nitroreductase family protein [Planctomycetales bacterium]